MITGIFKVKFLLCMLCFVLIFQSNPYVSVAAAAGAPAVNTNNAFTTAEGYNITVAGQTATGYSPVPSGYVPSSRDGSADSKEKNPLEVGLGAFAAIATALIAVRLFANLTKTKFKWK